MDTLWEDLDLSTGRFILSQLEKRLEATIDTAKILTDRAVQILQFSVPLSMALLGVSVSNLNTVFVHLSVIALVFLLGIIWLCIKVYGMYEVHVLGNTLENLGQSEALKFESEWKELGVLYGSIKTTSQSIEFNRNENRNRSRLIYRVMFLVKTMIVTVLIYSALWFPVFQSLFQ